MDESLSDRQSPKSPTEFDHESVGVTFNPTNFSAWIKGPQACVLGGTIIFGLIGLYKGGIVGDGILVISFLGFLAIAWKISTNGINHGTLVTVTQSKITLQGLSEGFLGQDFLMAIVGRIRRSGKLALPEPDGRVNAQTGKTVPFGPGEKAKVLETQNIIEEKVIKETSKVVDVSQLVEKTES
jgi:hypothetical protein